MEAFTNRVGATTHTGASAGMGPEIARLKIADVAVSTSAIPPGSLHNASYGPRSTEATSVVR